MLEIFSLIVAQALTAEPITMRESGPARTVIVSETYECGEVAFDVHYSATRLGVRGSLTARNGDELIEAATIQSGLFANLSYVDKTVVTCSANGRATLLVSGTDRETGEVDRLWHMSFSRETGFDDPIDISG